MFLLTSSSIFKRNVGDLKCSVALVILERSLCRVFPCVNKHDTHISQLEVLDTKFPKAMKVLWLNLTWFIIIFFKVILKMEFYILYDDLIYIRSPLQDRLK